MEIIKVSVGSAVHARLMAPSRYLSTPFLFLFLLSFALLPHDPHSSNFDFSFAPSHYYFYPPFLSFLASSVLVNPSTANLTNFPRFSFSSPSFFFFLFQFSTRNDHRHAYSGVCNTRGNKNKIPSVGFSLS